MFYTNSSRACFWLLLHLEYLFEHRGKETGSKDGKQQMINSNIREIIILDNKRSNAINIGMTKLPPPRTIKNAILKMDSSIINREGIEVRK